MAVGAGRILVLGLLPTAVWLLVSLPACCVDISVACAAGVQAHAADRGPQPVRAAPRLRPACPG